MVKLIDGKALAAQKKAELKEKISAYKEKTGKDVVLSVVLIGNDLASEIYVNNKQKACQEVGIVSRTYRLLENTEESEAERFLAELSKDETCDGVLLQLPLPKHLNEQKLLSCISPEKDVDGFTTENLGRLFKGLDATVPCTPKGIMEMLESEDVSVSGKNAVVIGRSNIVGKPMASLLQQKNATVTVVHSKTENPSFYTKNADILVVAVGKPAFLTGDMVKTGATVIDVGINRVNGKVVGDVDFESVKEKAGLITPVPGGVGPMTIACLLENTYYLAVKRNNL